MRKIKIVALFSLFSRSTGGLGNHHSSGAQGFAEDCKAAADVRPRDSEIAPLHHPTRKELSDGKETSRGVTLPSTDSVSSSTDPVHVPSPVSRSSPVGAIKREVRGGGFGGKTSEVIGKDPSAGALSKIGTPNAYRSSSPNSKKDQVSQTTPRESVLPSGVEKNRPLLNRQRGNRGSQYARTQQVGGHTKGNLDANINELNGCSAILTWFLPTILLKEALYFVCVPYFGYDY